MTSPSGHPPVGQVAASEVAEMVVHGSEPTGTDVTANGSMVAGSPVAGTTALAVEVATAAGVADAVDEPASADAALADARSAKATKGRRKRAMAVVPANAAPANAAPASPVPASAAPANAAPANSVPGSAVPASEAPANAAPVNSVPANAVPASEVSLAADVSARASSASAPAMGERSAAGDRVRAADTGPLPYQAGPKWAWFLPSILTLAVSLWGITTPSFWRDEAATIAAVRRPFRDLITMLGNVDAVHSVYYIVMWPLVHTFGPGELVLRLPSALAISAAAAGVAAIGRRLISPWAGLAAGMLFAFLPVVSRYGQEGRSYAAVMLVAVIASYFLVRVLESGPPGVGSVASSRRSPRGQPPAQRRWPTPTLVPGEGHELDAESRSPDRAAAPAARQRRRWLVAYGASLAVLGMVNIFGLLLIGGHAVTIVLQYRRHAGDHAMRRLAIGWLIAVVCGVVVTSPLLVFGWMERSQIAWLAVNTPKLSTLLQLPGSFFVTVAIVVVMGVAFVVAIEATKEWRRSHLSRLLAELTLPWLFVPPIVLLAASLISPVYTSRYILICVPPIALLGGAAIAALGRIGAPVALAAIVLAGLPGTGGQIAVREAAGHYDDIRGIDQIVAAQERPGDVVLYTNPNAESFGSAYSFGLGTLPNIAQQQAAIPSGTLAGKQLPTMAAIQAKLAQVSRVWIVEINKCVSPPQLLAPNGTSLGLALTGLPLHFVRFWHDHGDWLLLYAHGPGTQLVQPETACPVTTGLATS